MDPLAALLVLVAVGLTMLVILPPLSARRAEAHEEAHEAQIADLEAAKAARYREIREAEMDFRTGKLSEADWRAIDRQLRAEAVELLRRLDALGATPTAQDEAEPEPVDAAAAAPAGEPEVEPDPSAEPESAVHDPA